MTDAWATMSVPYLTPAAAGEPDAWTAAGGKQRLLAIATGAAPAGIAAQLQLEEGVEAVVRTRLLTLNGRPYEIAESWWPASLAAGTPLAKPKKIKGGAVTLLAEMGHTVARTAEDLTARAAGRGEASELQITPGAPVLVILRTCYDQRDEPFQVDVMVRPGGNRQRYELKMTG